MPAGWSRWVSLVALAAVAVGGGVYLYLRLRPPGLPPGFASGNGRIEATDYDVATKRPGRLVEVAVQEGDMVERGQVVARIDTADLDAQRRAAEAELARAGEARAVAVATVAQRKTEADLARVELRRAEALFKKEVSSQQTLDQASSRSEAADATLRAARKSVDAANASIASAQANVARIQVDIDDSTLLAPVAGRVLYRLAEPGEVLGAGGKVVTLLELTDVFMTIFLPTAEAGRVRIGSEARVVLDAVPQFVIPATVSFVAPEAQFTPKEVETRTEREKLMFRIKVRIDPELLRKNIEKVKTGLPGVSYVRLGPDMAEWPDSLQVRLPE
jgi:HlyD family secretion protein